MKVDITQNNGTDKTLFPWIFSFKIDKETFSVKVDNKVPTGTLIQRLKEVLFEE